MFCSFLYQPSSYVASGSYNKAYGLNTGDCGKDNCHNIKHTEENQYPKHQKNSMKYFEEVEAIENNPDFVSSVDLFSPQLFSKLLHIMKLAEYNFPDYPAIKTSNLNEVLGENLASYFNQLTIPQLNQVHQISHFFGCEGVRKCAAAAVACYIYFQPTLEGYNKKKVQLGIKRDLTEESCKKIRQKLPSII